MTPNSSSVSVLAAKITAFHGPVTARHIYTRTHYTLNSSHLGANRWPPHGRGRPAITCLGVGGPDSRMGGPDAVKGHRN
jgi:hypothetical protein